MSVRWIIGRAGTGKTHHCLAAIQEELQRSPVDGPRLVLLVPEQASLQMERALLGGAVRATARAEVLSFRRLALRVLAAGGAVEHRALSPAARAMVLRRLVGKLAGDLRYYRRVERLTGFFDRLGRTIAEFIEEDVAPGDLRVSAADDDDAGQGDKLADLAAIYSAYLEYLEGGWLDPSQYLQLAREALPRCTDFDGAHFWVDGFAGFTGQEVGLLTDLAARAGQVELTLLVDPADFTLADGAGDVEPTNLFARPLRNYLRLRSRLIEAGCSVDAPALLEPAVPPRYAASRQLAELEANFGKEVPTTSASASNPKVPDVCFVETPDRRTEVEFAVAQVRKLVRRAEAPLRYRDVAIVCRDLTAYHDLLTAALGERDIPYFIDRRRSLAHHPLVELLRGAAAVAASGAGLEPMRLVLKTDLLGLAAADADALENYILAYGLAGPAAWTGSDWTYSARERRHDELDSHDAARVARVNTSRRRVVEVLGPFCGAADARTGADWADVFRGVLARADVEATIAAWTQRAEDDGEVEHAAEHHQALDAVNAFLDDLGSALGAEVLDPADLAAIVEAGLAELTLGLIPPTVDQVLVGSIERSRHPDIRVSILIGFNEGTFPALAAEDVVLNDEDRTALAAGHVHVGVTRRQRVLDERMLAYVAVTRASAKLLITCALADEDGKPLRPSSYLGDLRRALPAMDERHIEEPAQSGQSWPLWTPRDLASALTLEFGRRVAGAAVDAARRTKWNDVYAVARGTDNLRGVLGHAVQALIFENRAHLSTDAVEAITNSPYTASVSELESYAACPFQRFARFGLRLRLRREADLKATDVGTVHHAILEDYLNDCIARDERFNDISDADILPRLERCAEKVAGELQRLGETGSARDAYLLQRSAHDLNAVVQSQRRVAAGGHFVPRAAERKYGFPNDPQSMAPLEIATPRGRRVLVRGVIDRIDLAEVAGELIGVVVDYKRTRDKRLDLTWVYHGLSLQLLGYLLALAERGETVAGRAIIPVGAFYVSLLRKYRAVDSPDDVAADAGPEEFTPRGIVDASRLPLLERDLPASGWAKVFKVFLKQDGSLGHVDRTDAATAGQFQALLRHTRRQLGALADGVLDGDVAVSPYRLRDFSPCHWCDMRAVCRFEFGDPGMRHLEALKRGEVLDRVEGEG
ncbi:MAG: PD-(D/E)XK nuclease family protein [Phycisphaerales bacterium]|nr:PD-(D/E)XK nuclease family protein [Phycisphaerales bacterium]